MTSENISTAGSGLGMQYRRVFENGPGGLAVFDLDGGLLVANQTFARMLGCKDGRECRRNLGDIVPPGDSGPLEVGRRLLDGEESPIRYVGRVRRENGEDLWITGGLSLVRDEDGEPTSFVFGIGNDHARHEAELKLEQSEQRFRALVDKSSEIVKLVDLDGTLRYASPALERILGYRVEEVIGRNVFEFVHEDDIPSVLEATEQAVQEDGEEGDETVRNVAEYRMRHADGTWRLLESIGTYLLDDPAVMGVVVNARDITERRAAEEKLRRSEETYRRVIETVGEVIFRVDEDGRWSLLNPAWTRITGLSIDETLGEPAEDFMHYAEREEYGDRDIVEVEIETRRGLHHTFEVSFAEGPTGEGFAGSFGILHDVTERKRLEERLERLAMYDPLTDLPNRRLFMKLLRGSSLWDCDGADPDSQEMSVSVLFVDLDRFKSINDSLGHDAGDSVLSAVAGRLRGCTRAEDTVARLGGEEFVVLMIGADRREAERASSRILEVFERPFSVDAEGTQTSLTASIGAAITRNGDQRPEELLRLADAAMYRVKQRGGNGFEVYAPEEDPAP